MQDNNELKRRAVRQMLVTDDDVLDEAERIVGRTLQRENLGDEIRRTGRRNIRLISSGLRKVRSLS